MKIKPNEAEVLNKLVKMYERNGNPIQVSSKDLDVMFWQAQLKRTFIKFYPTRQARLGVLKKLQEKGLITIDYSEKFYPKIIINSIDEAKQTLLDTPIPKVEIL